MDRNYYKAVEYALDKLDKMNESSFNPTTAIRIITRDGDYFYFKSALMEKIRIGDNVYFAVYTELYGVLVFDVGDLFDWDELKAVVPTTLTTTLPSETRAEPKKQSWWGWLTGV